jgi:peptidyl-prolyl cis-trans isomerase SurA
VVDQIVAVVGEEPILLSDVLARVAVFETNGSLQDGRDRLRVRRSLVHEMLNAMVDEALVGIQGQRLHVTVSDAEVDRAIEQVAQMAALSKAELLAEAERRGLPEASYRKELIRQLLQGKVLQVAGVASVEVSEADLRAAYDRMASALRRKLRYRPAWLVLRIPAGADAAAAARIHDEAARLAQQARSGQDFASLVRAHSADETTRLRGGDLGERAPTGGGEGLTLRAEVEETALRLGVGEVSEPFRVGDTFAVIKLLSRDAAPVPSFEAARDDLYQSAYAAKTEQARRRWLDELRRQTFVELRVQQAPKDAP